MYVCVCIVECDRLCIHMNFERKSEEPKVNHLKCHCLGLDTQHWKHGIYCIWYSLCIAMFKVKIVKNRIKLFNVSIYLILKNYITTDTMKEY